MKGRYLWVRLAAAAAFFIYLFFLNHLFFSTHELVLKKLVSPWQERDHLAVLGPQRRSVQPQLRRESEDVLQPPGQRRHHRLQEGITASSATTAAARWAE